MYTQVGDCMLGREIESLPFDVDGLRPLSFDFSAVRALESSLRARPSGLRTDVDGATYRPFLPEPCEKPSRDTSTN